MHAIDRCDVALLVLDATEMFSAQDTHIAGYIQQAVKGIVIIVNKWDLVTGENQVIMGGKYQKTIQIHGLCPGDVFIGKIWKGTSVK